MKGKIKRKTEASFFSSNIVEYDTIVITNLCRNRREIVGHEKVVTRVTTLKTYLGEIKFEIHAFFYKQRFFSTKLILE